MTSADTTDFENVADSENTDYVAVEGNIDHVVTTACVSVPACTFEYCNGKLVAIIADGIRFVRETE